MLDKKDFEKEFERWQIPSNMDNNNLRKSKNKTQGEFERSKQEWK